MIFRKEHGPANVATVVERMSRYTVIFRNNDRRSRPLMNRLIDLLSPLPRDARQSLTFDRDWNSSLGASLRKGLERKRGLAIRRHLGRSLRSRTPTDASDAGFPVTPYC